MIWDSIGLEVGGQLNLIYTNYDDPGTYFEGADDEERIESMLECFV